MKTGKRMIAFFVCSVFVMLTGLLCVSCKNNSTDTPEVAVSEPESNIRLTFEKLGVEDAEYIGIRTLDYGMPGDLRLYHSKSTGMDYYFYADTGIFKQASFENMEDADANPVQLPGQIVSEDTVTDPDELRQQTAIKFAEACIDVIRIGEMKIDAENNVADMLYKYTIYEYYDDIQTGTRVQLYFTPKGALMSCVVRQGELFKKDADGNVFMVRDGEKISEDAAIAIARKAVLDKLKEANWDYDIFDDQTKCSLQTTENQLVYGVEIRTGYAETDEWMRTFRVYVNVLDGSIWFMDWTQ